MSTAIQPSQKAPASQGRPAAGAKAESPVAAKPTLCFVYSPTSGPCRRMEGFLAQVLQRRHNHGTFALQQVNALERPELIERLRVTTLPTLLVIESRKIRGRLEGLAGCAEIERALEPWLKGPRSATPPVEELAVPVTESDPDASYTRVSLGLSPELTFERWQAIGRRVAGIAEASTWWLADWAAYGESSYGEKYRPAVEATGIGYQTLRNYAWVAGRFDPSRRRDKLSFAHHAEVAALSVAEQDAWLERAEADGWSRNELRDRLRAERESAANGVVEHLRLDVPVDQAERWRSAAESDGVGLPEWLIGVADLAASA
ncbi:MAG TPA: LmbU family transcriptional regulator [Gaiellaceae bacterium]|nr:LmbU family transcriptional regulator [Gaiellaceae bacterium]